MWKNLPFFLNNYQMFSSYISTLSWLTNFWYLLINFILNYVTFWEFAARIYPVLGKINQFKGIQSNTLYFINKLHKTLLRLTTSNKMIVKNISDVKTRSLLESQRTNGTSLSFNLTSNEWLSDWVNEWLSDRRTD